MSLKEEAKKYWDKFWFLLWKDDSFRGWAFSIVFLIIFIKFIFFPMLSFVTGTSLPLAIVESCSMYHEGNLLSNFDSWWENNGEKYSQFNIEKSGFEDFGFRKGFNKGDILFIRGVNPDKLEVGDVIVFQAGINHPVIHRIIGIQEQNGERIFSTMGDHNIGQLQQEKSIAGGSIIGKASIKAMPYFGWIKLVFFEGIKSPSERGFC
ncbi:signal peptidase I [Candidatus Pacearchaeota archaeon]|nr:signal peptidase I [Candidatus Pacearchaeota archaeon]